MAKSEGMGQFMTECLPQLADDTRLIGEYLLPFTTIAL